MVMRRGIGKGRGRGYKNMVGKDPYVHSMSAKGIKQPQKVKPIMRLNVNKYSGRWFEIKSIPKWFQEGCKEIQAQYTKKKGYIEVKNTCVDEDTGNIKTAYAKAYPLNKGKSKLEIDFVGGRLFTGDYWVLFTDYKTALVGSPDRNSLWILSRTKKLSKEKINKLEKIAKKQGFDVGKLE